MSHDSVVLLTDRAWPDSTVERDLLRAAGLTLVEGPAAPAPGDEIERLVARHDPIAVMTCWAQVSAAAIAASSRLKVVARMGVGLDNIAVDVATRRGVLITNVPDYCVEEVSDHAVGMMLNWTRGLTIFDRDVRSGTWQPAAALLGRLRSKTVGIVGYGRIGHATARKLGAFGCSIVVHSESHAPRPGVDWATLPDLLSRSDIVVLHLPLTPRTELIIGEKELRSMRPGALLVNVGRGGLVDTDALVRALDSGHLAGAALDVLEDEPVVPAGLLSHPGVTITPHIAFSSVDSVLELRRKATEDVIRVANGLSPNYPCNAPAMVAADKDVTT